MQELIRINQHEERYQACEICCLESAEGNVIIYSPSVICYNCWHQHLKTSITKISYKTGSQIISPFEGRPAIDVCLALNTLQSGHATQLEEWLFKKYSSFTPDIEKCPSEACDYVFTMQKCKWRSGEDEKCPKCDVSLVQSTGWDLKGILGFIYFVFLTNKCPKCQIPIEKTTGCPHMTCPCGHQFCWYCLKDYYYNGNNVYSVHEPKECASIFISKIIFMSICISGIILTFLGNQFFHQFINYFFIGLKYLMGAVSVDLIIIVNCVTINHLIQKYRNFRAYGINPQSINSKLIVALMVIMNFSIMWLLYYLDLHMICLGIILVQLSIAGFIAGIVWLIVYSVETWFDFIC